MKKIKRSCHSQAAKLLKLSRLRHEETIALVLTDSGNLKSCTFQNRISTWTGTSALCVDAWPAVHHTFSQPFELPQEETATV